MKDYRQPPQEHEWGTLSAKLRPDVACYPPPGAGRARAGIKPGRRLFAIALSLLTLACASSQSVTASARVTVMPSVDDVVRVIGATGFAHACSLKGGRLATNRHVIENMWTLRWSDGSGNEGTAEVEIQSPSADLAILHITSGKPSHEYPVATQRPAIGDRVVLRGYRYDGRKNVLSERRVETKVSQVEAGHIVYEQSGFSGSSGSCVFNAAGEVIGINAWAIPTETRGEDVGLAVGLWGAWALELEGK